MYILFLVVLWPSLLTMHNIQRSPQFNKYLFSTQMPNEYVVLLTTKK